jgi:hypothetical protein
VSAQQRHGQIPIGAVVAAAGAVLLIVSLFLDWYEGVSGFTVFEFVDLLLVMLALVTVLSLVGGMGIGVPAVSPPVSVGLAGLAIVVVVTQVLNDPPAVAGVAGPAKDLGIWLALAGSALMVAGALLAGTQISLAVEPRRSDGAPARSERDATATATAPARAAESSSADAPARGDEPRSQAATTQPGESPTEAASTRPDESESPTEPRGPGRGPERP